MADSWSEMQAGAVTPEQIKKDLPVAYVLEKNGHMLEQKGQILATRCPFHADGDPSFDVFDGGIRWGCYPCGKGGDVLDLIREIYGGSYGKQMDKAVELRDNLREEGWQAPAVAERTSLWDPERAEALVTTAQLENPEALYAFLDEKSATSPRLADLDPEDLRSRWSIGCAGDEIIVPYWNRQGELVAYKHRTADTKMRAAPGSVLGGVLYGEWLDKDPSLPVLLCEGESDTWAAADALPGYSVLGLSSGAGSHPNQASSLANRRVVLAFDGDEAGRKASVAWSNALISEGCTVELLPVPDGMDLCKLPDIARLLERTRSLKPAPTDFKVAGDIYVRPGKENNTMLTNWRIEPEIEMSGSEGSAYEGTLVPSGRKVTITSGDLSSKSKIVSWCSRQGVSWLGSDRDAQQLLAWLQHKGPYLSSGNLVHYAGLHEGSFVWPGGRIGSDRLVYSPPPFDIHLEQRVSISEGPYTVKQVSELRELHHHKVMDPILAWLAAAPVRSLLPSFPVLAITGGSGVGKTTLIDTVIPAFSGSRITSNLTSTTRHAVGAYAASTNAFPTWFDEYRPGGRKDTMMFLEQLIRDAYTMQQSSKGGLGENWAEIAAMDTHSPLIVSGEDTFTETSHTERMVNLPLPVAGKNPAVLDRVRGWGDTGFAHAYLTWLSRRIEAKNLPTEIEAAGPSNLPVRQRDNIGLLHYGWDLLSEFCDRHGLTLGPPDLSLVTGAGSDASGHNPIKDALLWLKDEPDVGSILRVDPEEGRMYVRVVNFVTHVNRTGSFTLPGKQAAVHRYLVDNYDGREEEHSFFSKKVKCLSISLDELG